MSAKSEVHCSENPRNEVSEQFRKKQLGHNQTDCDMVID